MRQTRRDPDLAQEALGTRAGGELGSQNFDRDAAIVLAILRREERRPPAESPLRRPGPLRAPARTSGVGADAPLSRIPSTPATAMAKQYWLMKSEPESYSIDDLERDGTTAWDGVRNHQARNHMQKMSKGDLVLYYHSRQDPPAVVGIAEVAREAYPDPSQFDRKSGYFDEKSAPDDPRWWLVDVRFVRKLQNPVSLRDIKAEPALADMVLVRNSRLSVQPVKRTEMEKVLSMVGERMP